MHELYENMKDYITHIQASSKNVASTNIIVSFRQNYELAL